MHTTQSSSSLPPIISSLRLSPTDPTEVSTDVILTPVCTELREPRVQATVEPPLRPIFNQQNSSNERFSFGYVCEGSVSVAQNFSRNVIYELFLSLSISLPASLPPYLLCLLFVHLAIIVESINTRSSVPCNAIHYVY